MDAGSLTDVTSASQPTPPSPAGREPQIGPTDLPTPVRQNKLAVYLKDYKDKDSLIHGFKFGFPLPSSKTAETRVPINHPSVLTNPTIVDDKIRDELAAGRIAGPFSHPPLPGLVVSPLGLVPKKLPGDFRMIHDLSYPKGDSVNSHMLPGASSVSYELLDDAVRLLHIIGPRALMAKADIEAAFRLVPIHPSSYHLTGFSWRGQMFYDKVLPFGAATSCATFEAFSSALQWILQHHFNVKFMSHILDDFMFFGPPDSRMASQSLQKFLILADDLGIPVKHTKTVHPATKVELHGILVDTAEWTLTLPPDKTADALAKVSAMATRKKTTLREIQSLIGTLNFATKVVIPGRTFLRRLIDLTIGITCPTRHISLNSEARADLNAWKLFLQHFNGKYIISDDDWVTASSVRLHTAHTPQGCALMLGRDWARVRWPADTQLSTTFRQLCPIALALQLWAGALANRKIHILSPSPQCTDALNAATSRDHTVMALVRPLVVSNMSNNIQLYASTATSSMSTLATELASFQANSPTSRRPYLHQETRLNPMLLPWRS